MAKLNAKQIYEKEFTKAIKGYNDKEVDEFLDIILEDYQEFSKKIYQLETELEMLKNQAQKETFRNSSSNETPTKTNLDLLQRVSNLEKEVFGKKD